MNKFRVVIVTPEAPDPFGNAAARWYFALAKGLAGRSHAVRFLSAYSPASSELYVRRAKDIVAALNIPLRLYPYPTRPWLERKWNTFRRPYSYFISDELRLDLSRSLRDGYDILNLEQMWAGYLGFGVERALVSIHHLELLDLAGVASGSMRSFVAKHLMFRAERDILAKSRDIRVTTSRLSSEVTRLNSNANVFTVPVAIDPDLYEYVPGGGNSKTLGLIASFGWTPGYNAGVRLLTRIWPRVKKAVPEAKLLIVGWSARVALGRYLRGDDVTVMENVPDTKEYFQRLSALVYPLSQGSGMKVKLLEAMGYGTPIVTTTEGAEGLELVDGHHALIADEDDLFVDKATRLLRDSQLRQDLGRAGRALLEERYSPGPIAAQMERVYETVVSGRGDRQW